ncbi:MAG: hypothetical protein P0Y49_09280 [Candidatus Pedobacter colombiensis]|uniref:Uncharacterized protein n=1 Tax=Candidatus Pedobacter colombiensis TaxID=3121371 RepID=A0AAJ6B7Q0_9SPHI|nr:hypothetical protein [Pedobacter sp.]WEK21332.1 MAG: hypothetical protein P0Y49_09280 [Pedobacter sp.]
MQTYFSLDIKGISLELISMNVTGPKLFQVFTMVDGKKKRFHMQGKDAENLAFVHPHDCPDFLLNLQDEIITKIIDRNKAD